MTTFTFNAVQLIHECISTTKAKRHWAASLAKNRTLRVVSLESNQLDSQAVKDIAQAIAGNKDSEITQLRLAPQKKHGPLLRSACRGGYWQHDGEE